MGVCTDHGVDCLGHCRSHISHIKETDLVLGHLRPASRKHVGRHPSGRDALCACALLLCTGLDEAHSERSGLCPPRARVATH